MPYQPETPDSHNLGRPERLDVVTIGSDTYLVGSYGYLAGVEDGNVQPITLDDDGCIPLGAGWTFSTSAAELARVGIAHG